MNFLPIIMSHGRPDKVMTYSALRKIGYTGKILVLIDNEDKCRDQYLEKYGDEVYIFDKAKRAKTTDTADNFPHRRAIVYARNACYDIAKELGHRWFMQLDDDYTDFRVMFDQEAKWKTQCHHQALLPAIEETFKFLEKCKQLKAVAWAQTGDFIGGDTGSMGEKIFAKRKCMNVWFCDSSRPVTFVGHMNEDASAYILGGLRGDVFMHTNFCAINQLDTQKAAGGMTEAYLDNGTYLKTFYSIMQAPSCVRASVIGTLHDRIHHNVSWNNCAAKILNEKWRKAA